MKKALKNQVFEKSDIFEKFANQTISNDKMSKITGGDDIYLHQPRGSNNGSGR